jgi:hypothetical protein
MKKIITHKIRKGSPFQIINDQSHARHTKEGYYVIVFITDKKSRPKIERDIRNFVQDNQEAYGQYALLNDHIDTNLSDILLDSSPALIEVNADGVKRFNDTEAEKLFWRDVVKMTITPRTKQRTIIITTSDENYLSHKIQQNANFIFA